MVYVNGSHIVHYGLCGHVYVYFAGLCEWFMVHMCFWYPDIHKFYYSSPGLCVQFIWTTRNSQGWHVWLWMTRCEYLLFQGPWKLLFVTARKIILSVWNIGHCVMYRPAQCSWSKPTTFSWLCFEQIQKPGRWGSLTALPPTNYKHIFDWVKLRTQILITWQCPAELVNHKVVRPFVKVHTGLPLSITKEDP